MTPEQEQEMLALDWLIDAVHAGSAPSPDELDDSELAGMLATVLELRALAAEPPAEDFPKLAAMRIAAALAAGSRRGTPAVPPAGDSAADGRLEMVPQRPGGHVVVVHRRRRNPWREGAQIAAAVLVLVLVTAVLKVVLDGRQTPPRAAGVTAPGAVGASPRPSTLQATPAATPPAASPTPAPTSLGLEFEPRLQALQAAAGFRISVPTWLPAGVTLAAPRSPMRLPGFTSVRLDFQDASGRQVLAITEASPYQDTRETMPPEMFDNAVEQDLGNGLRVHVYQAAAGTDVWWQDGPTSIRLSSGAGQVSTAETATTALRVEQLLSVARSMIPMPVPGTPTATPIDLPGSAAVRSGDAAVARARQLIATLGDRSSVNVQASVNGMRLMTVAEPSGLGMPVPPGIGPAEPVWQVEFSDALVPAACPSPQLGNSVCSHGDLVVVVDAMTGEILGWHGADGRWKAGAVSATPVG